MREAELFALYKMRWFHETGTKGKKNIHPFRGIE